MDKHFQPYLEPGEEFVGWFPADTAAPEPTGCLHFLMIPFELIPAAIGLLFFGLNEPELRLGVTDRGLHFLWWKKRSDTVEKHTFFEHVLIRNFVRVEKRRFHEITIDFAFGDTMYLWVKKTQWLYRLQDRPLAEIFEYAFRSSRAGRE